MDKPEKPRRTRKETDMDISASKTAERRFFALLSYVSPALNTRLLYLKKFGRLPELRSPQGLNEKLLKLKLESYGTDPAVRMCADKYRVRDYVRSRGCADALVGLIAVYDDVSDIDWDALPDSFAMKWNFGCGYNIICPDKSALDIPETEKKLRRWGREPFWAYYSELQYRNVPKKLVVENYLAGKNGALPEDYKFYCFNGRAYCVMVCQGREAGWPKFYFFDRDFRLLRLNPDSRKAPEGFALPRPDGLDEAFALADRLSEGFPFVRADLYIVDGRPYFGELTFTPAAALDNNRPPDTDLLFGRMMETSREGGSQT